MAETPATAPPPAPMTAHEVRGIFAHAHEGKQRRSAAGARDSAAEMRRAGRIVSAYRCPFSAFTGGPHWHVGHVPSEHTVERIAAAIRWVTEHGLPAEPDADQVAAYAPGRGDPSSSV